MSSAVHAALRLAPAHLRLLGLLCLLLSALTACRRSGPPAAPPPSPDAALAALPPRPPIPRPALNPLTPEQEALLREWQPTPSNESCAECHPDEAESFAETGMGRALFRPDSAPRIEDFSPNRATVRHPVTGVLYQASVDESGRWWQEERTEDGQFRRRVEALFVFGSGNGTRSYIGQVGQGWVQLPLTWYSEKKIWDMSPGYHGADHLRFERAIVPECLFCHNDLTPIFENESAHYAAPLVEGISCARCHGHGAEHARLQHAGLDPPEGEPDPSILNPARLSPDRQHQICMQCHILGEIRVLHEGRRWDAYDPRVPLEHYFSAYLPDTMEGRAFPIAGHGQRLSLSPCFTQSQGKLSCTTCHNPHKRDLQHTAQGSCLGCHQQADCTDLPHHAGTQKTCAGCHMHVGETSDIPHVLFTDHYIRARPHNPSEPEQTPATLALVDFFRAEPSDPEQAREAQLRLGRAHLEIGQAQNNDAQIKLARHLLQSTLTANTQSPEAWFALARAQMLEGDLTQAVQSFETLAQLEPESQRWRPHYARVLDRVGRTAEAITQLEAYLKKRSEEAGVWGQLGNLYQQQQRYSEADWAYARADAQDPSRVSTANDRGMNALKQGKLHEAQLAFQQAVQRDALSALPHFNLAQIAELRRDFPEALRALNRALALDPEHPQARIRRGHAHLELQQPEAAQRDFEHLTQRHPKEPNGWLGLAEAAVTLRQLDRAEQALREGLRQTGAADIFDAQLKILEHIKAAQAAP